MDARKARVIELYFFGGLSVEEAAEVLKVSPGTVMRDWRMARAWLLACALRGKDRRASEPRPATAAGNDHKEVTMKDGSVSHLHGSRAGGCRLRAGVNISQSR
jgi:hypothetical protein